MNRFALIVSIQLISISARVRTLDVDQEGWEGESHTSVLDAYNLSQESVDEIVKSMQDTGETLQKSDMNAQKQKRSGTSSSAERSILETAKGSVGLGYFGDRLLWGQPESVYDRAPRPHDYYHSHSNALQFAYPKSYGLYDSTQDATTSTMQWSGAPRGRFLNYYGMNDCTSLEQAPFCGEPFSYLHHSSYQKIHPQTEMEAHHKSAPQDLVKEYNSLKSEHISHHAKPYILEHFETPFIIDHIKKPTIINHIQTPIIIDHFQTPTVVEKLESTPLIQSKDFFTQS